MMPTLQYYSKVRNIIQIVKVICILVQYSPFCFAILFFYRNFAIGIESFENQNK